MQQNITPAPRKPVVTGMRLAILLSLSGLLTSSVVLANDTGYGEAEEISVPVAKSFVADGGESSQAGLPIVVLISRHSCRYCAILRQQVLHPVLRANGMADKAILREVSLDDGFVLEDFSGLMVSGAEFASVYAATVTPTLLFLDSHGKEVADKMVGINNVETYDFYLMQSIDIARRKIAAAH